MRYDTFVVPSALYCQRLQGDEQYDQETEGNNNQEGGGDDEYDDNHDDKDKKRRQLRER